VPHVVSSLTFFSFLSPAPSLSSLSQRSVKMGDDTQLDKLNKFVADYDGKLEGTNRE
jgi:hypothetical protein